MLLNERKAVLVLFLVLLGFACSFAAPEEVKVNSETPHIRDYTFSFMKGNLITNWSFEDSHYGWECGRYSKKEMKEDAEIAIFPVSGSYVGVADAEHAVVTEQIPIEGGETYVLSFYVDNLKKQGFAPQIRFYSSNNNYASTDRTYLKSYEKESNWAFYEDSFVAPTDARFVKIILASANDARILFDDVVLEKGVVASNRNAIGKSIIYSDGVGLNYMTQTKVRKGKSNDFDGDYIHAKPYQLIPSPKFNMYSIYAHDRLDFNSRTTVLGGNISADDIYFDNDVLVKDENLQDVYVSVRNSIFMKDRVSLHATVMYGNKIQKGNQDYIRQEISGYAEPAYLFDIEKYDVGSENITIENDKERNMESGSYGNVIVRSRGILKLSAGRYIFKSLTLESFSKISFDLSLGNVVVYIDNQLSVSNNVFFTYDENSERFVRWELAQKTEVVLGNDSRLYGIFIAPNSKISLGDRSELVGALYARNVTLKNDSKVISPTEKIFENGKTNASPKPSYAAPIHQQSNSELYMVSSINYDGKSRVHREYLPFVANLDAEGYFESSSEANRYYSDNGDGENADGFAFFESAYSPKDGSLVKKSKPGKSWNINSGHLDTTGVVYVKDLSIPSDLDLDNLDFSTKNNSAGAIYGLTFVKNSAGQLSLSWKNVLNQVVKEARLVDASDKNNLKWAITEYEYSKQGYLTKVRTPLDVANGNSDFAIERSYDAAGMLTSTNYPDIGLVSYFYDLSGTERMSVSAEQRERNAFSYKDYDRLGRISSVGESILSEAEFSDEYLRSSARYGDIPGKKTEYFGYAYDKLDNCFAAIGLNAFKKTFSGKEFNHTRGRLVCEWARNPHALENGFSAEQAIVVDLFSYDSLGRVHKTYRYTGLESSASRKNVSKQIVYNDIGQIEEIVICDGENNVLYNEKFIRDNAGRVISIKDGSFNSIVDYSYDDLGRMTDALYGGFLQTKYSYHLHGQVSGLHVENLKKKEKLFEQNINYEDVTGISAPRYDGKISEITTKYAVLDNEVEEKYSHYYDLSSNLTARLSSLGELYYSYDANGRLLKRLDNMDVYDYVYNNSSYQLSRVNKSKINDSQSSVSEGSADFDYDVSGRLFYDAQNQLTLKYDPFGKSIRFDKKDGSDLWKILIFYGPRGEKVGQYIDKNGVFHSSKVNILIDEKKIMERYEYGNGTKKNEEYGMILANGKILGRILPENLREWYVNDYQGSLVMSVQSDVVNNVISYKPFGIQNRKIVSDGVLPSEQYTGKEFDEIVGLYDFGARYFNPELGLWLSPDPAQSFLNPYSFGGDPINYIDPNGLAPVDVNDIVNSTTEMVRNMTQNILYQSAVQFNEYMWTVAVPFAIEMAAVSTIAAFTMMPIAESMAAGAFAEIANAGRMALSGFVSNVQNILSTASIATYNSFSSGALTELAVGYFGVVGMPGGSDIGVMLSMLPSIGFDRSNLTFSYDFSEGGNLKAKMMDYAASLGADFMNDAKNIGNQLSSFADNMNFGIPSYTYTPTTSTPNTYTPTTSTPNTYTPTTYTPYTYTPTTYTPNTYTPTTYTPYTYTPTTYTPNTYTPGTSTPGTYTPGTSTPGTYTPGTYTPGTYTPGTYTPGTSTPGTYTPGTYTPGTYTPGTYTWP